MRKKNVRSVLTGKSEPQSQDFNDSGAIRDGIP